MSVKSEGGNVMGGNEPPSRYYLPRKLAILLCIGSFCVGIFVTNRVGMIPEGEDEASASNSRSISMSHELKQVEQLESNHVPGELSTKDNTMQVLERTISKLELELAAARVAQETILNGAPASESLKFAELAAKRKYLMVIGINTAFSGRKRRDSVRATWMPQGDERKKLEEEKGIIIRFVIGHSSTSGGILDKAIEAEERKHGDFLRLEHVEGYMELSAKTKAYFVSAVGLWDADFYVKVDDDVHVNLATLGKTLARYRLKPRAYIGCMKSGPILAKKGVRYHEPEHWKFGGEGNKYFRHATGQLYAISRDLATYIAINQNAFEDHTNKDSCVLEGGRNKGYYDLNPLILSTFFCHLNLLVISDGILWPARHVLHKYANEDISLGSWLIGLDVSHIDDKRLCCGTPPGRTFRYNSSPTPQKKGDLRSHFYDANCRATDCEWKAQAGNICVASFDWTCSGICRSDERIYEVHQRCGEGENAIWNATF
ncbi:hypothetical protein Cgig2_008673 [Carnegiea gigantea]|uniref:Hexosyltransferase n=1 Tax=Carnegiea gigantea TaxID=171969 RepID=A0A9Q1JX99_9CARY|nr:hypothetical protein Cgig2_008673 [Carnegiea gigantea]